MTHFTNELAAGWSPDPELVHIFALLFSNNKMEYVLNYLIGQDPFSRSLTGDRTIDLWRAWREARLLMVQGKPLEAFTRLQHITNLHPIIGGGLPDLEIQVLIANGLLEGNRTIDAHEGFEIVRKYLSHITSLIRSNPHAVAEEIRMMLSHTVSLTKLRSDLNDKDLIGAWVLGREVPLLLDTSLKMVNMPKSDHIKDLVNQLKDDIISIHTAVGCAFDLGCLVFIESTLGNCWTESDPERALVHFESVVELCGLESGDGLAAAANAANCLMRLRRFGEARSRYSAIESLFEMRADYLGAARVWAAECIAEWHETGDASVRHSLVGAIKLFEENIPRSADVRTLFTLKKYMDPGYLLLISLLSDTKERSDDRLNELLGASWTLLSRDFRFTAKLDSDSDENSWMRILVLQQRPLSIAKTALMPFRGTAIVHLFSVPDRQDPLMLADIPPSYQSQRLVWIIYGYDCLGRFRFETSVSRAGDAVAVFEFLETLEQQLSADIRRDPLQVASCESDLIRLGEEISKKLSGQFVEALLSMNHVYYMPYPFENLDEFPLGGLRFDGNWLSIRCTITRSPTINHLREVLNPNRPRPKANSRAVTLTGDISSSVNVLYDTSNEMNRVVHMLRVYGFDCETSVTARINQVKAWLDGGVGVLHYIGHGIATNVFEILPLSSGEMFRAIDLDSLTGFKVPFVFLCACEAARIRHGAGGYQIGLASKLTERASPAVLAFSMPIPENRAYEIVRVFYRQAFQLTFGSAVLESQKQLSSYLPTYSWLALSAYGDPDFLLSAMATSGKVPMSADRGITWHSMLRSYAVLRTQDTREQAINAIKSAPTRFRSIVTKFLNHAFVEPPASTSEALRDLEKRTISIKGKFSAELLSIRAAICLERAHYLGLDANPICMPSPGEETRRLFSELHFVALVGSALFDARLGGLGNSLTGRLLTWENGNIDNSAVYLRDGIEKLEESSHISPYVKRIRDETISIFQQLGGSVSP